jgi:hypothetical protein
LKSGNEKIAQRNSRAMILYPDLYPLEIEFDATTATVTMRSGYFDAVRTMFMDEQMID